ncbi:MAG TPA: tripartite tricarboxylate transporter substrate-binding protein, partial [Burkholderiales bacterium]|nr:tripartite tricarboxylate transporter substrate-binding protein [Burkholderiales bacterium]
MLRTLTFFLAALLAPALVTPAAAQDYPVREIRSICNFGAGSGADIVVRYYSERLSRIAGKPVVVENKPGANGNVGADFVAKSAPDGYTLLLTDLGGLVISASVYPQLPFNPAKDFTPVIMVSYSPHVLAVHPSVPVKDVRELIAMAKAQPGKLNFAISGIGGAPHLAGIEFAQRTGVLWTYIPYKGGSDAVAAVAGGQA